jgi:hypothetical protein
MIAHPSDLPRRSRWLAFFLLLLFCSKVIFSTERKVWYLSFTEVAETLRLFADSGIPGSDITDSGQNDVWRHPGAHPEISQRCCGKAR